MPFVQTPVGDVTPIDRPRPRHTQLPVQRSFDELGRPLSDVTFCVIDLETTGGNRNEDQITEVGAVIIVGGIRGGVR